MKPFLIPVFQLIICTKTVDYYTGDLDEKSFFYGDKVTLFPVLPLYLFFETPGFLTKMKTVHTIVGPDVRFLPGTSELEIKLMETTH